MQSFVAKLAKQKVANETVQRRSCHTLCQHYSSITITFIATITFSESNIGVIKFKLLKLNAAYNWKKQQVVFNSPRFRNQVPYMRDNHLQTITTLQSIRHQRCQNLRQQTVRLTLPMLNAGCNWKKTTVCNPSLRNKVHARQPPTNNLYRQSIRHQRRQNLRRSSRATTPCSHYTSPSLQPCGDHRGHCTWSSTS